MKNSGGVWVVREYGLLWRVRSGLWWVSITRPWSAKRVLYFYQSWGFLQKLGGVWFLECTMIHNRKDHTQGKRPHNTTKGGNQLTNISLKVYHINSLFTTLTQTNYVSQYQTYGHELWVVTERTRSPVQAAEMSFLRRLAGLSLRDRVRSSVIRRELGVDPLLVRVKRSQMRWLGHLIRMPPGRLPGEVFRARPTGRRPRGRPRTRWRDYVSRLAWERLGIPWEELDEVAAEREVWASLLRLLPPGPDPG